MFRFDLCADAFLQHMVRNIVGALIYASATVERSPEWLRTVLESRERKQEAAPTFAASGLHLTGIDYPVRWNLPPTHALAGPSFHR